ncbi:MAG: hypothetical protein KIS94_11750 [Chitinophagales bacterium]|nr:hypothetical protein [Chitinophagales bacterium]
MKNFLPAFLLILIVSYALQLFLPWWIVALVALLAGFALKQKAWAAFVAGFAAVFVLWGAYAFILSSANNHLLADKIAELMKPLTGGNRNALFIITGTLGGLVGGLGCLTGNIAAKLKG